MGQFVSLVIGIIDMTWLNQTDSKIPQLPVLGGGMMLLSIVLYIFITVQWMPDNFLAAVKHVSGGVYYNSNGLLLTSTKYSSLSYSRHAFLKIQNKMSILQWKTKNSQYLCFPFLLNRSTKVLVLWYFKFNLLEITLL